MSYALDYLKNMFGLVKEHDITYKLGYYLDNLELLAFAAAVICSMPVFQGMLKIRFKHKVRRALVNVWLMMLFILSVSAIAASTYNPFIYFRF